MDEEHQTTGVLEMKIDLNLVLTEKEKKQLRLFVTDSLKVEKLLVRKFKKQENCLERQEDKGTVLMSLHKFVHECDECCDDLKDVQFLIKKLLKTAKIKEK